MACWVWGRGSCGDPAEGGRPPFWEMKFLSPIPGSGQLSPLTPRGGARGPHAVLGVLGSGRQRAAKSYPCLPPPHPGACESCLGPMPAPRTVPLIDPLSPKPRLEPRAAGPETGRVDSETGVGGRGEAGRPLATDKAETIQLEKGDPDRRQPQEGDSDGEGEGSGDRRR